MVYLHADQLGSVGVVTQGDANHAIVSSQEYEPWGKVLTPSGTPVVPGPAPIVQTTRNYTGQKLDGTGLLDYNVRLYDPVVGRFVSPDSIADGARNAQLIADFHEGVYLAGGNRENAFILSSGFWYKGRNSNGPTDPQTLGRYSYVRNNPVLHTDSGGHCVDDDCMGGRLGQYIPSPTTEDRKPQGWDRDGMPCYYDPISGGCQPPWIGGKESDSPQGMLGGPGTVQPLPPANTRSKGWNFCSPGQPCANWYQLEDPNHTNYIVYYDFDANRNVAHYYVWDQDNQVWQQFDGQGNYQGTLDVNGNFTPRQNPDRRFEVPNPPPKQPAP